MKMVQINYIMSERDMLDYSFDGDAAVHYV